MNKSPSTSINSESTIAKTNFTSINPFVSPLQLQVRTMICHLTTKRSRTLEKSTIKSRSTQIHFSNQVLVQTASALEIYLHTLERLCSDTIGCNATRPRSRNKRTRRNNARSDTKLQLLIHKYITNYMQCVRL